MANLLLVSTRYAVAIAFDPASVGEAKKRFTKALTSGSRSLGAQHPYLKRVRYWRSVWDLPPALIHGLNEPGPVNDTLPAPGLSSFLSAGASQNVAEQSSRRLSPLKLAEMSSAEIVRFFGAHETDSGRAEVQIALATKKIRRLTKHLDEHPHDHSTRRGLLIEVGKRRRLLTHLRSDSIDRYRQLVTELELRR